jgi:hypothetical protein
MRKSKAVRTGLLMAAAAATLISAGCDSRPRSTYFNRPLIYRDHPRVEKEDEKRERNAMAQNPSGSYSSGGRGSGFVGSFGGSGTGTGAPHSSVARGGFGGTATASSGG